MQKGLFLVFIAALAGAGWYFYERIEAICPIPLAYSIGQLDAEFGLSEADAIAAVEAAEKVWEEKLLQDLFVYDPAAPFTINFIFDERQERSEAEAEAQAALATEARDVETAHEAYETLQGQLQNRTADFEDNNQRYEQDLAAYNNEVARYNESGGAPPAAYRELEDERARLERVATRLEEAAAEINTLTDAVNGAGESYNTLAAQYNDHVRAFNSTYANGREFTQGDYTGNEIHIYTFADADELRLVLAHELGHALSIDHVPEADAVMYYMLGDKATDFTLTRADTQAFYDVCSAETRWWEKLPMIFHQYGGVVSREGV